MDLSALNNLRYLMQPRQKSVNAPVCSSKFLSLGIFLQMLRKVLLSLSYQRFDVISCLFLRVFWWDSFGSPSLALFHNMYMTASISGFLLLRPLANLGTQHGTRRQDCGAHDKTVRRGLQRAPRHAIRHGDGRRIGHSTVAIESA